MKQRWLHLFTVLCALPAKSESNEQPRSYDGKATQDFKLKKQACPCSNVKKDHQPEWEKHNTRFKRDNDDRIVGGYAASQNKPWVARIWINPKELLWRDADQQEIYSDRRTGWAWCAIPRENQYMMSRHGFQVKQI